MPNLAEWVWINLKIGALSFGGSGRSLLYQDALVREKGWLTEEEFFEVVTLAQLLPGPNLVNLAAYISHRLFANRFASVLAVLGLSIPGAILGVAFVAVIDTGNPHLVRLFQGFSFGSIVLFLLFLVRMALSVRVKGDRSHRAWTRPGVAVVVAAACFAGAPILWVLGCGILGALVLEFAWD